MPDKKWTIRSVRDGAPQYVPDGEPPVYFPVVLEVDGPWSLEPGDVLVPEALLEEEREKADDEYYEAVETVTKRAMKAEAALLEAVSLLRASGPSVDPDEWHRVMKKIDPDYATSGPARARSSLSSPEADRG